MILYLSLNLEQKFLQKTFPGFRISGTSKWLYAMSKDREIVYRDYSSSLNDLLKRDKSVSIHHRNIQSLAVELFKVIVNLSNTIMNDNFPTRVLNYNLRSQTDFFRNSFNTTKFGLNSLRYFASKVWSMIPIEIKNSSSVETCKNKIRKWEPNDCDCKVCQDYLYRTGYVNLVDH